ncbi:unnamed protein product [Didymodactylos carnosus]|uniref:Uncharacterized protein n=1 Tax=Didymodactylos carnosus TaxID=1234261 RepID=A0A814L5A6_9BILA|nr:unnamed protein product [Didymodactylos carnosus]CAF1221920.1 unnamed protein product [Didymodactylos carnosus]CAF3828799.1 unnamed protein product [Didymodactylos carnosus]CAF4030017.1 unnamed protein product [Didymodactylos carnosus]
MPLVHFDRASNTFVPCRQEREFEKWSAVVKTSESVLTLPSEIDEIQAMEVMRTNEESGDIESMIVNANGYDAVKLNEKKSVSLKIHIEYPTEIPVYTETMRETLKKFLNKVFVTADLDKLTNDVEKLRNQIDTAKAEITNAKRNLQKAEDKVKANENAIKDNKGKHTRLNLRIEEFDR